MIEREKCETEEKGEGRMMKGIMKKAVSLVLTMALAITGINYMPDTVVKASGTIVADTYTAEITDGNTNFKDQETVGAVTYNNYIRYGATIVDKSAEDKDDGCLAEYAIDNNSSTRWADKNSGDSGYITVDLGAAYSIYKIYVNWETANAKSYKIEYSNDGTNFTDGVTIDSSANGAETAYSGDRSDKITLNNEIKGRYVKIQILERCIAGSSDSSHPYGGVSIREIGIYGISNKEIGIDTTDGYTGSWTDESSSDGWKTVFGETDTDSGERLNNYVGYNKYRTVTAKADMESGSYGASKAIDGIAGNDSDGVQSRWAAETTVDGHWLTVNLGTEYNIKKICISWEKAQSEIYNIETSNDGVNFDTAATVNATCWDKNKVDKITLADTVKAQYVRIYTLKRANIYGSSIWEIGIYGPDEEVQQVYDVNAFEGYATTNGNYIEGENFSEDISSGVQTNGNENLSNGGNLGSSISGSVAGYKLYFDRKTSKVKFSYSARSSNAAGNIKMYVDDMTGTPAAIIATSATGGDNWNTYVDVEADVQISQGEHKIYLVFEPNDGKTYVANIDYFQFQYTPEDVEVKNEAENAHSYTRGSASQGYAEENGENFSGGKAIKNMDTWASDERSYLTTYVKAAHAGTYQLTIAYATENATTTQISYRVNRAEGSEWRELDAPGTGAWDAVKTIETEVTLQKGINAIDISGARNTWADGKKWEYVNIDYFRLDRVVDETNIALGKPVMSGDTQDGLIAENVVDGDNDTRWAAKSKEDNWLTIDLQGMYEIEQVQLLFERAYPSSFEIQVSRDNQTWVTARTVTNFNNDADIGEGKTIQWASPGENDSDYVCLGKAAYIRIQIHEVGANYVNASIHEFLVRGEKVPGKLSDVALNKTVTASSSNGYEAKNAVDGNDNTRWASAKGANQWYQIYLGGAYELHSIDLKFERAYAQNFVLQISDDGETWTDVYTKSGWDEPGKPQELAGDTVLGYSIHLDSVKAAYVRINVTGLDGEGCWNGLSIYEFEVWGRNLSKSDYWEEQAVKTYGIYPVSGLQESEKDGTLDSSLVQGNVLGTNDTYEVIYEPGKEIYFYVNPRDFKIDYNSYTVCWSSAGTGTGLWGADFHDEGIADYQTQNQATVKYVLPENLDFGDSKEVTTEIGCQIYDTSDIVNGSVVDGKVPKFSMKFTIKVIQSSLSILDTIKVNGCISVKNPEEDTKYEWQKSSDGKTWDQVPETRYDLTIITDNGKNVNVANDLGGGMYYRARKQGASEWSYAYQIPYYNNVQNGDFEYPAMYSPDESGARFPFGTGVGDEQQFPNGLKGMIWKTTGPGWNTKVGHDIEIINGRRLKTDGIDNQSSQFSVTLEQMYQSNQYGDQFAELNCENIGALYQDILTVPDSICSWNLDHAGRWNQNSMFVVAMAANDAEKFTTSNQIAEIVKTAQEAGIIDEKAENAQGVMVTLKSGEKATIWKVTSPEKAGVWEHHSGTYNVPGGEHNYLTRFFFASEEGASSDGGATQNDTVGNLIDNVTFETKQDYSIEYYIEDETEEDGYKLVYTLNGEVQPYDRVAIPSAIEGYNLDIYTLSKAIINGSNYYMDSSGAMTVAYGHNNLKLYYNSATIAVTKKIEGLDTIPEGYNIAFSLSKPDGTPIGESVILTADDFTKVEQNGEDREGYFATLTFKGTDLGIIDGTDIVVTEKLVPMIGGTDYYLEKVEVNGEVNTLDTDTYFDGTNEVTYSKTITYYTDAPNTVAFVNGYQSAHKVKISKNVINEYLDVDLGSDKSFQFTMKIQKDEAAVKALAYDTGIIETDNAGEYTFSLKDDEMVELTVLDGCTVTVEEDDYSKEFYAVQWSGSGSEIKEEERKAIVNAVDMDTLLTCTNTNVYYGDVEVQGFQMNTDNSEGGVSEFSPSFRVVSRACKKLVGSDGKLHKVTAYGTIYALDSVVNDSYNGKMRLNHAANSEDVYSKDDMNTNIYYFESKIGTYLNWTTRQPEDPYYNYFALTFVTKSYSFSTLETDMAFRAYAKLDNGEIVYGTKVYSVNIYKIAENLYKNIKMGTKKAHEFLYTNVLNLVTMNHNRVQICQSMMVALEIQSTSDPNYLITNKINRDINDYVYCQKDYRYSERTDFLPKSLTEEELSGLLDELNSAAGTKHGTLSDWIYNETPNYNNYQGFYQKVPYDWDSSIYQKRITK